MAENSKIEWTDHTFNPWIGCQKVSPACDNCYAEAWDQRFKGDRWGAKSDRTRTKTWGNPIKWNKHAEKNGTRYRVFCASLADVFDNHKSILPEWRNDLWALIKATPHLDWLLLTKRPQNIGRFLPDDWADNDTACYPNVWLMTTAENQEEYDRRWKHLDQVNCMVRGLSCEPLLGHIDFRGTNGITLDWVIVGGENHSKPRHMEMEWLRSIRDQCAETNTAFLFKQWSGKGQKEIKAKGRKLDGVIHNGYPELMESL